MITGHTRVAGVIGSPIRHSLSPAIHNAAFAARGLDWAYTAFEVAPGEAAAAVAAIRVLGFTGLSVTTPHKDDVAAALDELTGTAARLEAVNCVVPRGRHLVGDNTDGGGFLDALATDLCFDAAGRCCVVVGAGGAARAVVLALAEAGAGEVAVVNRTPHRGERAAALAGVLGHSVAADAVAGALGKADLVVNATSVGMRGAGGGTRERADTGVPFDVGLLAPGQIVVDLVYEPPVTPLVASARERGVTAVGGVGMLVHQAARAFRQWTGEEPPLDAMTAAAKAALSADS